jgi:mono/diheme cytochrome c family protein
MHKILKIVGIVVAALVVVAAAFAVWANWRSEQKRNRVIELNVAPVKYVSDEASIARGKYLFESRGCMECHGADGAGREVVNVPGGLYVKSPNISPGPGSVVKDYTEIDWVRTIRHGVSPSKHPFFLMPSKDYSRLTDADLASVVAYVRSLPPASGSGSVIRLPFVIRAFYAVGAVKDDAEEIDHTRPPPAPTVDDVSVAHGAYVANMCTTCHGEGLSGGKIPGAPPDWPAAANLTPGTDSALPRYDTVEKFTAMMRTGKRPDGSNVSTVMPFPTLRNLNDTDVGALYAYLKSLPPRPAGGR